MRILLWVCSAAFALVGAGLSYGVVQYLSGRVVDAEEVAVCAAVAVLSWAPALGFAALAWIVTLLGRMAARG